MMELCSMATALLFGITSGLLVFWIQQRYRYNYPPSIWCPPIVGHLLQININTLYLDVIKWSEKLGPVVTVYLGLKPVVFVNKIEPAREVLVKKSTDFADRHHSYSLKYLTDGYKGIALTNYGNQWRLHRKLSIMALRHNILDATLEQCTHNVMVTTFEELDTQQGKEIVSADHINFAVVTIMTGLCFGGSFKYGDKEIEALLTQVTALEELFTGGVLEDIFPPIRHVYKSRKFREFEKFKRAVSGGFIGNRYWAALKSFDQNNLRHVADHLILASSQEERMHRREVTEETNVLTDTHMVQVLGDICIAAIGTSRYTLQFAVLHMIAFPDIQAKVQKEIDAVVAGYNIPKGTNVVINQWAIHHDSDEWENPEKFIPERHLDESGKLAPKPQSWLPFSAGKRSCLGEFVAKPGLLIVFAALMQRYKWRPLPGETVDIRPHATFMFNSPKPYKCLIEKRI